MTSPTHFNRGNVSSLDMFRNFVKLFVLVQKCLKTTIWGVSRLWGTCGGVSDMCQNMCQISLAHFVSVTPLDKLGKSNSESCRNLDPGGNFRPPPAEMRIREDHSNYQKCFVWRTENQNFPAAGGGRLHIYDDFPFKNSNIFSGRAAG